jgi:Protein of unknown function (DUF2845)
MTCCVRMVAAMAIACLCVAVRAESLRCPGGIAAEGDSKISVLFKCGQPLLKDSFCPSVYYSQTLQPVPEPIASAYVPCQLTDEWLYDRGPGNLVAKLRFRSGVMQSVTYGQVPQ